MFNLPKLSHFFYLFRQNLKNSFFDLFAYLYVKIYLIILAVVNISTWLAARYFDFQTENDLAVLHYNVDFGIDLVGEARRIYIIPLLGLIIILLNLILLAGMGRRKDRRFISHLLFATALIANIILLVSLGMIYLINFH